MGWFDEVYPTLPAGIPDAAYDAVREQYWATRERPKALQSGVSIVSAREEFMKATERPGKSSMPAMELMGATAAKALTAPLGMTDLTSPIAKGTKAWAEAAHAEAQRQGVGTMLPEMAGHVAGELPYWIGGMKPVKGLAEMAGKRLGAKAAVEAAAAAPAAEAGLAGAREISRATELVRRPIETALGGLIQGVYDATSAEDGHRITAGLQGAALGAGATAGTVYAGSLWRWLRRAHGLDEETAKAVEAVAQGRATQAQEAAAGQVAQANPGVGVSLEDWLTDQVKAANMAGRPVKGLFSEPVGKVKVTITGADGKSYRVGGKGGVDVWHIDKIARLVGKQLEQGGVVDSVSGDPGAINALYLQFDHINAARGAYDAPAGVRGLLPAGQEDQIWMRLLEAPKPNKALSDELRSSGGSGRRGPLNVDLNLGPRQELSAAEELQLAARPYEPATAESLSQSAKEAMGSRARLRPLKTPGLPQRVREILMEEAPSPQQKIVSDLEALIADPSIPEAQKRAARIRLSRVKPQAAEPTPLDKSSVSSLETRPPTVAEPSLEAQAALQAKVRAKQKLDVDAHEPRLGRLEALPSGKVRDRKTGEVFNDAWDAYKTVRFQRGPKSDQVFRTAIQGDQEFYWDSGFWKDPHDQYLGKQLKREWDEVSYLQKGGAVSVENNVRFNADSAESVKAAAKILAKLDDRGFKTVNVDNLYGANEWSAKFDMEDLRAKGYDLTKVRRQPMFQRGGEGPSRRGFLGMLGKGAASAALPSPAKVEGLAKAAQSSSEARTLLESILSGKIEFIDKGWIVFRTVGHDVFEDGHVIARPVSALADARGKWLDLDISVEAIIEGASAPTKVKEALAQELDPKDFSIDGLFDSILHSSFSSIKDARTLAASLKKLRPDLAETVDRSISNYQKYKPVYDQIKAFRARTGKSPNYELTKQLEEGSITPEQFQFEADKRMVDQAVGRTTGKELTRTPLALGPEGEGGLMMRYAQGRGLGQARPGYKETPQAHRVSAGSGPIKPLADSFFGGPGASQIPEGFRPRGATYGQGPGQKPAVFIGEGADPSTLFHESLHGNFAYLDMHRDLHEIVSKPFEVAGEKYPMAQKMSRYFTGELADNWARDPSIESEEIYTYLSEFIRMNNQPMLQEMAEWDAGYANMMQWYTDTTQKLLGRIASLPDSVHKRALERRLKFTQLRAAGDVQLINHGPHQLEGDIVDFINGQWWWYSQKNGTATAFSSKDQLLKTMEELYAEPISAPNLVDESSLPQGFPRFAVENAVRPPAGELRPPIHTEPPLGPRPKAGRRVSFYFRPFGPWLGDLAADLKMPDLYGAFKPLENAYREMTHFTDRYAKVLNETIGQFRQAGRQDALYHWLEAKDKALATVQFNITPKEEQALAKLRTDFFDPLFSDFGIPLERYLQDYAPHIRARALQGDTEISALRRGLPKELDFFAEHIRTGDLDPRDTHLLRVAATYLRLGARKKFLSEPSVAAGKFIAEHKTELGSAHYAQLKRHIEHVRGVPDFSQELIDSAVNTVLDTYNASIAAVNKVLPFNLEPLMTDLSAREAMGRYMLYTYSAGLGLRPIAIIRDSTQTLTTSLPLLGPKYLAKGLKEAFSGNRARAQEMYQIAREYGAVLEHQHLASLYSGGYEFLQPTKLNEFAQRSLKWYEAVNNGGRLVTFYGHAQKAYDAIRAFKSHNDIQRFFDESAIGWLDKPLANSYAAKALQSTPDQWLDLARRAAKDLTDVSHWNYTRGAHPGLYKYSVGRLFGQYGTWPLNYIEYARRLSTAKGVSSRERLRAFATLATAHGAILSGLESQGIDASGWVLSSPAAYGGGPVFNALVQSPTAVFDWQTYRGDEARRSISRTFWPMSIPAGTAASDLYRFANEPNPSYLELLGFKPLEEETGVFKLTPTEPPRE